jgi:hypothetical protein
MTCTNKVDIHVELFSQGVGGKVELITRVTQEPKNSGVDKKARPARRKYGYLK